MYLNTWVQNTPTIQPMHFHKLLCRGKNNNYVGTQKERVKLQPSGDCCRIWLTTPSARGELKRSASWWQRTEDLSGSVSQVKE